MFEIRLKMKGRLGIEQQISEAKASYPSLAPKSQYSYSIIYPDSPQNQFEILIKQNFPDSAPLLYLNGEKIQIPLTTFWHPDFSFLQILQHLHLYSNTIRNQNMTLSPPMKNLPSPSIYESKIKSNGTPVKFYGRLISLSKEPEEIIEEEEEEPEVTVDDETYQKRLNELNLKLKNKQIHISDYMIEHQTLKTQNGEK